MRNRGFEVCVGGRIVETKDWQLNANVTMGHYKNEVERLTDGNFITNVMGANVLTAEGNPLGVFYGYKSEGVFTDMEDASKANLSVVDNTGRNLRFGAGDMHFADIKVDGIIDEHDMTIIGDPNPDIYGAFGFNVNWKRLSLDAIFTYSLGNDAFNAMRQQMENGSSLNNQSEAMLRRWTGDGQATDIPRATYGDPMGNQVQRPLDRRCVIPQAEAGEPKLQAASQAKVYPRRPGVGICNQRLHNDQIPGHRSRVLLWVASSLPGY